MQKLLQNLKKTHLSSTRAESIYNEYRLMSTKDRGTNYVNKIGGV